MENRKIIKSYLETLPSDMTISSALMTINKEELTYQESINKQVDRMREMIGKVYYYEDDYETATFVKFITKITDVVTKNCKVYFEATVIEISDETIYYLDKTLFCEDDLKSRNEVPQEVFAEAKEKYDAIKSFAYKK